MPKVITNSGLALSHGWVKKLIVACGKELTEVTNLLNYFKWVCSAVPKVIQNKNESTLNIVRVQLVTMNLDMKLIFYMWPDIH